MTARRTAMALQHQAILETLIEPAFEVISTDSWWVMDILSEAVVDIATRRAITVWRFLHHLNQAQGSDCQEVYLGHLGYAFECAAILCQIGANASWCRRGPDIAEL